MRSAPKSAASAVLASSDDVWEGQTWAFWALQREPGDGTWLI